MKLKADLMTPEDMRRALKRMSHQILERNQGAENLVLLGIRRREYLWPGFCQTI